MIALRTEVPANTKQERLFFLDWLRVLAVLGVFYFHTLRPFDWLNFNKKRLPDANEAVLPFYVLQQPVIIFIAFYVVQWNMAILPKWLIISTLALMLILAVYELLIRRVNGIRWLFGMKPRPRTPRENVKGGGTQGHKTEAMGGVHETRSYP